MVQLFKQKLEISLNLATATFEQVLLIIALMKMKQPAVTYL